MAVTYPEQISPESMVTVMDIVRKSEYKTRYPELFLHGWNLQGSLQKLVIGEPIEGTIPLTADWRKLRKPKISEAQFVAFMEILDESQREGVGVPQRFIDKGILIQLIAFILQKLLEAASK